jgi:hypothetical protein
MTRRELFDITHSSGQLEMVLMAKQLKIDLGVLRFLGAIGWSGSPTFEALDRFITTRMSTGSTISDHPRKAKELWLSLEKGE